MCYLLFLMALWAVRPDVVQEGKAVGPRFPALALFTLMASDVFLVLGKI